MKRKISLSTVMPSSWPSARVDSSTPDAFSWTTRLSFTELNTRCGRVIRLATAERIKPSFGGTPLFLMPLALTTGGKQDCPPPSEFTHTWWTTAVSSPYGLETFLYTRTNMPDSARTTCFGASRTAMSPMARLGGAISDPPPRKILPQQPLLAKHE